MTWSLTDAPECMKLKQNARIKKDLKRKEESMLELKLLLSVKVCYIKTCEKAET